MTGVDARELKLRIQGGFSSGELRRLLESLGAPHGDLPDDRAVLANHVVRVGEKSLGLNELVRRLKHEKPLYEWPEVEEDDTKWASPRSAAVPDLLAEPEAETAGPTLVELELPKPEAPIAPPTEAAPPSSVRHEDAPVSRAPASRVGPASTGAGAPSARGNLLVFEPESSARPEDTKPRGHDPRILIAALGLMVVLAAIAFGAGLAWRGSPSAAASSSADATPAPRSSGLAGRAADQLDKRLANVAGFCDLDLSEAPSRAVLEVAQRGCGTAEQERLRRQERAKLDAERPRPSYLDEPTDQPEEPSEPVPVRTPGTRPAQPAGNRCLNDCQRVRSECVDSCGPEPTDASGYDKYQACTGKCLTGDSRCRLACN